MRVLLTLTYYRPNLSGLTIYVDRLAHALRDRGHAVTVLASQADPGLALHEVVDGIEVVRVPVPLRVGKGVLMPGYGRRVARLLDRTDVVSAHLPQVEAAVAAVHARRAGVPFVVTHHCDLQLPPGALNRAAAAGTFAANLTAARLADRAIAYTRDYADHSPVLRRVRGKLDVIPPPVVMPEPPAGDVAAFRARLGLAAGTPVVGMAARVATEKGVEVLLDAYPALAERHPGLTVLFAGPYADVLGERRYWERLSPRIAALGDRWRMLGALEAAEMPAFLAALDCLVVPSLNSTESFGLVQVEAMLCGTPVVASDLPGVRQPVRMTGMGEVAARGDADELAGAVTRVLGAPERYARPRAEIAARFDLAGTVAAYEAVFERCVAARGATAR